MPHSVHSPEPVDEVHDVLIVGAGPCGLAVAARLRETTPSALYTDEEHRRYHWLAKHTKRCSVKDRRNGRTKLPSSGPDHAQGVSLKVLDGSGDRWLARWDRLFDALKIQQLRSPMFFHVDPSDRDSLLAFAHAERRTNELMEIAGCVGKEISKHKRKKRTASKRCGCEAVEVDERDRKDYFTPSTALFRDFCMRIMSQYELKDGLVSNETVSSVDYGFLNDSSPEKLFTVQTNCGTHHARTVVLAVGAGNSPNIPAPFPSNGTDGAVHAMHLQPGKLITGNLALRLRRREATNVLVIGGGLTSAQIVDSLVRAGLSKVWQLTRGPLRVKPFDIDLQWMGKYRNGEKASFWMADSDGERAELLKLARGGGSVTPRYFKRLKQHMDTGRLALHTNTKVISQQYSCERSSWSIQTEPPVPGLPELDHVYFATGMQTDIATMPCLQELIRKYPVEVEKSSGLPVLTDDLQWTPDVPLFVTGKLAGLRLGPGAANLEGARAGAERVGLAIDSLIGDCRSSTYDSSEHSAEYDYAAAVGSRFASLELDEA